MKEGIEQPFSLSEAQRDRAEFLATLIQSLSDSFVDSNDAYETADSINAFYDSLKAQGFDPKRYYLWGVLNPHSGSSETYTDFDTPDGQIESFIDNLAKEDIGA